MNETYSYDELIDMYYGNTEAVVSKKEILEIIKGDHRINLDEHKEFTNRFWRKGISNKIGYTSISIDKLKAFIENSKPIVDKKIPRKRYLLFSFSRKQSTKDIIATLSQTHLFDDGFSCFPILLLEDLLFKRTDKLISVRITKGLKDAKYENRPIKEYCIAILECVFETESETGKRKETEYYDIVEDPNYPDE